MKAKSLAEALHRRLPEGVVSREEALHYNAGIDALADALDESGYTIVSTATLERLVSDIRNLAAAGRLYESGYSLKLDVHAWLLPHWTAANDIIIEMEDNS